MKDKRRKRTRKRKAMESKSRDEECHITLSPETSPIYGGATLVITFSEDSILPADTAEFYIVYWGLTARHVSSAIRSDYRTLEAVVPGHDRFEEAHLAICALQPGLTDVRILAKSNFNFTPDSTFHLAQFLASSVWDPDSLDNPQAIKSQEFDLETEDRSTLDSRLTAAFQHLEFPASWNLVVDSGRLDENPPPRETLLHFATRLRLISFAEHLLERPGYIEALRIPNKSGEAPYDVAKSQGLHKLADRMLQLVENEDFNTPRFQNVPHKPSSVNRHSSLGTSSVTTKVHECKRTLGDDIQMLREMMSCLKDEDDRGGSPDTTSSTDPENSIASPTPASPDTLEEILTPASSDGEGAGDAPDGAQNGHGEEQIEQTLNDHPTMNHQSESLDNEGLSEHASQERRSEEHASQDHASLDHASLDHASLDHVSPDHASLDHASLDHASPDHASLDHEHVSQGDVSRDHGLTNNCSENADEGPELDSVDDMGEPVGRVEQETMEADTMGEDIMEEEPKTTEIVAGEDISAETSASEIVATKAMTEETMPTETMATENTETEATEIEATEAQPLEAEDEQMKITEEEGVNGVGERTERDGLEDEQEEELDEDNEDDEGNEHGSENNSEEEAEAGDTLPGFDDDIERLHEVRGKVLRFRDENRPYMSSAEERRENLSRWSTSCPVLMEDGKPSKGWSKQDTPSRLPSAIENSSDEEEEEEEADSVSRDHKIEIQVNDTSVGSKEDESVAEPEPPATEVVDAATPSMSSEDLASRRHSWGDHGKGSSERAPMRDDFRCRSMMNLDARIGTEGFHMHREEEIMVSTVQQTESEAPTNEESTERGRGGRSSVKFKDDVDEHTEPVVGAILPSGEPGGIHGVVVRRRRKRTPKDIRKQKSASMFEARSDDSEDSMPSDDNSALARHMSYPSPGQSSVPSDVVIPAVRDLVDPNVKEPDRFSFNAFLDDPTNFMSEAVVPQLSSQEEKKEPMFRKLSFLVGSRGSKRRFKEKDKDRDKEDREGPGGRDRGRPHQFVVTSYSNSTLCEVCKKHLHNKPAVQCQGCCASVHASCKESAGQCSKLTKHPKAISKSMTRLNTAVPGNSFGYSESHRDKPRPISDNPVFHQSSQSFQKAAFRGSSPELRASTNSVNSNELGKWHWHRVAVKLGVNRTIDENEESEDSPGSPLKNSTTNFQNSLSVSTESLDDVPGDSSIVYEPDDDLVLTEEPESWSVSVDKKVLKKMSNKEIKRQDVIYEFIMTEKHHLRTLKIMQKIFSYGMTHELHMEQHKVNKVFPMLDELVEIASTFCGALKARQGEAQAVHRIGDVLCKHFEGENGERMKKAYGYLCSRQKEAVSVYKDLQKTERKFGQFIKRCSTNALCRRWSIPECILSVSHRLTKYHLLIEAIMKPTKAIKADKQDHVDLERALNLIKGICNEVDRQVAEYEKYQRMLEIYNKVEARSTAILKNGKKFKKSDLLDSDRKLLKEGEVCWKSARGRLTEVNMVLVTDRLFLFSENNQKYTFASQDNKPPVISLEKLMVRDVAIDHKSVYIISRYAQGPEMYEIMCKSSHERKEWKKAIEHAVTNCPIREDTVEEEKRLAEERLAKMGKLLEEMKEKDQELQGIVAARIKLMKELHELTVSRDDISTQTSRVAETNLDDAKDVLEAAIREASSLQSLVYDSRIPMARCASSAGENKSALFQQHVLPKRAETFSGYDTSTQGPQNIPVSRVAEADLAPRSSSFPNLVSDRPVRQDALRPEDSREEDDVLSPMTRDSPQRSPLPPRRASERSNESRRGSSDSKGRGRSSTLSSVSSGGSGKVQFNVPVDESNRPDQPELEDDEAFVSGGMSAEQSTSVYRMLKHFYLLLPLISKKENEVEVLRTELTDARNKNETYKNLSQSPAESRRRNSNSAPGSPAGQELRARTGGRSVSLHDRTETQRVEKLNNQKSLPETSIRQENLERIAFGTVIPSNQTVKYRTQSQSSLNEEDEGALQVPISAAHHKHRYSSGPELISRTQLMWDQDQPPPAKSSSSRKKEATPDHLMSMTNEQSSKQRHVKQRLPSQLSSKGKPSKTSPVQQVLPRKLSSGSKQVSQKSVKNNNLNAPQTEQENVIYF